MVSALGQGSSKQLATHSFCRQPGIRYYGKLQYYRVCVDLSGGRLGQVTAPLDGEQPSLANGCPAEERRAEDGDISGRIRCGRAAEHWYRSCMPLSK